MSVANTEVETFFGRCRCCLSYGYLKNMWTEHQFEGETEVYGEMLVQCFALTWDHTEDTMEQDQICEQCICRLRDASDFKKVVLDSQDELLHQIEAEKNASIKEETIEEDYLIEYQGFESEADTADTAYTGDTNSSVKEEMVYEEVEYLEDEDGGVPSEVVETGEKPTAKRRKQPAQYDTDGSEPKRKWPKKLPKSERLKTYKQYSEEDLRKCLEAVRNNEITPAEASVLYKIPKKTICAKMKLDPKDVPDIQDSTNIGTTRKSLTRSQCKVPTPSTKELKERKIRPTPDVNRARKTDEQNKVLMSKHKHNLKMILEYSNATMIKGNAADGYSCSFCDTILRPNELKEHNFEHVDVFDKAIKVKYVSELIIKLDVTGLECRLCDNAIDSLEELMTHLKEDHEKLIYTDISNHFVPFKFDTDTLQCAVCFKEFKYFKLLSEHMCEHYRNYECVVCKRPFINRQSMQSHSYRHEKGEYKCSLCPKIFDNKMKVSEHERVTHALSSKKRKCKFCNEKFSSADMVKAHEAKKHGVTPTKYSCEACNKPYHSHKALLIHKKRHHLMMRPFECDECQRAFFTRQELKWHSVTHTKIKNFQCEWCNNTFGTKPALNQHLRAHLGDRKYKCDHCDVAFVHLSTWKMHLFKVHGEKAGSTRNKFL